MTESAPDVSILVVSYNTRELARACLASIFRETHSVSFEVIVVDNDSSDGSPEMIRREFPAVLLIESGSNLGFAAANNLAVQRARGAWLLLLNPDTVVLDGAVQKLHRFALSRPGAGVVGGRTFFADGSLNPTSCRAAPTPWSLFCHAVGLSTLFRQTRLFDPESLGRWQRDCEREVDVVTGCFFMVSRALWDELGGFDPVFFMYGEETDFCLRARARGYRPSITPAAGVIHHQGASEPVRADKMVRLLTAQTTLVRRHWSPGFAWFGIAMLWLAALSRSLAVRALRLPSSARRRDATARDAWPEIWRRRRDWISGYR